MRKLLALVLLSACVDAAPDLDEVEQEVQAANGISINGISINGISINGISINGISINGISINGTSLVGSNVDTAAVTGSTWTGTLVGGGSVEVRIDAATQSGDHTFYSMSYGTGGTWQPLCGAGVQALVVPGTWNQATIGQPGGLAYTASTTELTLACRGATIAKCVELGYTADRPDHLASCVRALRGDYCGTGIAYTTTGNLINVYDNVGIQADTTAWAIEAEWAPTGARCINSRKDARFPLTNKPACVNKTVPVTTTCGAFRTGTSLIVEFDAPLTTTTSSSTAKTSASSAAR